MLRLALLATVAVGMLAPTSAAGSPPELSAKLNDEGEIFVVVDPKRQRVCFRLWLSGSSGPTAGYIQKATNRGAGQARVNLFEDPAGISGSTGHGCMRKQKRLRRIAKKPRKFYVTLDSAELSDGVIRGRLRRVEGGFETGRFREFDDWSTANGSLSVTRKRAYEGSRAARATNDAVGNQFQRVQYDVDWREGSDVWYGVALYIPRLSNWCWWYAVRWDNWQRYRAAGDVGGLRIERGRLYLDKGNYTDQTAVLGPVEIPEGRWFWVDVHQRLSHHAGSALNELYLDGVRMDRSTAANSSGRRISHIRYGNVAMATSCSRAASIFFDRIWLSDGPRGPLPGRK